MHDAHLGNVLDIDFGCGRGYAVTVTVDGHYSKLRYAFFGRGVR